MSVFYLYSLTNKSTKEVFNKVYNKHSEIFSNHSHKNIKLFVCDISPDLIFENKEKCDEYIFNNKLINPITIDNNLYNGNVIIELSNTMCFLPKSKMLLLHDINCKAKLPYLVDNFEVSYYDSNKSNYEDDIITLIKNKLEESSKK
jgi:hypothetical protein